jgi:AcrR family transcriptional regulator
LIADTPARRTGRPTLDEAAALQQKILDETLSMVASSGSEGFSVDQLADKIAVTKRTVYRHHKNKNGLILAAVKCEIDRLLERSDPVSIEASQNPIVQLRAWIKALFDYLCTPRASIFINFMVFESSSNEDINQQFLKWHDHVLERACELIRQAQDLGLARPGNPRRFSLLLFDLITSIQGRTRIGTDMKAIFGDDDPEQYFEFRWMAFLSLVSDHPWARFVSLA